MTAHRCHGCGVDRSAEQIELDRRRPGMPASERWLATGDLDVEWLVPAGRAFVEARFCRSCAPAGSIVEAACSRCAGGPLVLLGETLPLMPVDVRAWDRAVAYLRRGGWHVETDGTLTCPACC